MSSLIKNTFFYSAGNLLSKTVNFLLLPIYTSFLSPSEFGIVSSMEVFSTILLIFFTLGLERAIYRLYFDYQNTRDQELFLGTVFISIIGLSLMAVGILFLFRTYVGRLFESIEFSPYYVYAILTAFFMTFELVPRISLQVREMGKQYFLLSGFILVFRVVPVVYQVVFLENGALGMLKGAALGNGATLLFLIPIAINSVNFRFSFQTFKKTLKYSLPLVPV